MGDAVAAEGLRLLARGLAATKRDLSDLEARAQCQHGMWMAISGAASGRGMGASHAIGHTLGFSQADPKWGLDALLASLRSTRFDADGFSRSWWEFYTAIGYIAGLFYLFSALLAWQLGGLSGTTLARLRGVTWGFAVCFAAITVVSWLHLFLIPIAFSAVITITLTLAAWLSAKPAEPSKG